MCPPGPCPTRSWLRFVSLWCRWNTAPLASSKSVTPTRTSRSPLRSGLLVLASRTVRAPDRFGSITSLCRHFPSDACVFPRRGHGPQPVILSSMLFLISAAVFNPVRVEAGENICFRLYSIDCKDELRVDKRVVNKDRLQKTFGSCTCMLKQINLNITEC